MRRAFVMGLAAVLLTVSGATRAFADAVGAEQLLEQAVEQYALAEFARALDLLKAAERLTDDPKQLAAIYRQRGLVQEVLRRPHDAVVSFARAIRCDRTIDVEEGQQKITAVQLFRLAKATLRSGADAVALQEAMGEQGGRDADACGGERGAATGGAGAEAPSAIAAAPPPAAPSRWPIWVTGGGAVAAAAAGGVLGILAANKDRECAGADVPAAYADCDRTATALETGASVSFAAAGVLAATALALWVFEPRTGEP